MDATRSNDLLPPPAPARASPPMEPREVLLRSPRLRVFETERGWIAYHSLFLRPRAIGKDVVKILDWLATPRQFPDCVRGNSYIVSLIEKLKTDHFVGSPGVDELGLWISGSLGAEHLHAPTRALWDGWSSFEPGGAALIALRPFIEKSAAPFPIVVREGEAPLDWGSVVEFLEAHADRDPNFEWLTFVLITSGRGLDAAWLRSLLPYNLGFLLRTNSLSLDAAMQTAALLTHGRATSVLARPFESLLTVGTGEFGRMMAAGISDVVAEVSESSEPLLRDGDVVARARHLVDAAAGAGVRLSGPWQAPGENACIRKVPDRFEARLEITSNGRVLLQSKDIGTCEELGEGRLEGELKSTRLLFTEERCRSCAIVGACPGEHVLRPSLAGGAVCDLALASLEQRLESLVHAPAREGTVAP